MLVTLSLFISLLFGVQIILNLKYLHRIQATPRYNILGIEVIEKIVCKAWTSQASRKTCQHRAVWIICWEFGRLELHGAEIPSWANNAIKSAPAVNGVRSYESEFLKRLFVCLSSINGSRWN